MDQAFYDLWVVSGPQGYKARGVTRPSAPGLKVAFDDVRDVYEAVLEQRQNRSAYIARFAETDYRVNIFRSGRQNENETVQLRRLHNTVPGLSDTALPHALIDALQTRTSSSGMVIISGVVGVGKTWTASAIFTAALAKHGLSGAAIEDPPELPLEGEWGDGFCWQIGADEHSIGEAVFDSLRRGMRAIMIGEVRTSDAAREAINAAAAGYLVIFCLHAGSPVHAVQRLLGLAAEAGREEMVAAMMAEGLVALVHLEPSTAPQKWAQASALFGTKKVAATIRNQSFHTLVDEIERQETNRWRLSPAER